MPNYVIRSEGAVNLPPNHPHSVLGQFLEWYRPRANAWAGELVCSWTTDIEKAMKFDTAESAASKWREPLVDEHNVPRQRRDAPQATGTEIGIERPLTAWSVSILTEDAARQRVTPEETAELLQVIGAIINKGLKDAKHEDDDNEGNSD